MARSHRKNAITPNYHTTAGEGKSDKRLFQRRFRALERKAMLSGSYESCPKYKRESVNVWDTHREGKCFWTRNDQRMLDYIFIKRMRK